MKKISKFRILLPILLLIMLALALTACGAEKCPPHTDANSDGVCDVCGKVVVNLAGVSFRGDKFYADGQTAYSLEVSGTLPTDVTVKYEGNGKTEVGAHIVTAKFYYNENYLPGCDLRATLEIKSPTEIDLSDIKFNGKTVDYNGSVHSLAILGTLPDGVGVKYVNNDKTGAGEYPVTAKFYYSATAGAEGMYIEGKDLTATLKINKCDLTDDIARIPFNGASVDYDGTPKSLLIDESLLPTGVSVSYTGNGVSAVGTYTITATFTLADTENYKIDNPTKTATLKIVNAIFTNVRFEGITVPYDGAPKSIEIDGTLPEGYTVDYVGNGVTALGKHTVTAKFYYNGVYQSGFDMTANITITENNLDDEMAGISFNDLTVIYNGKSYEIKINGTLPTGVSVSYEGNGKTDIGTYTVKAKFTAAEGYSVSLKELSATLTIVAPNLASGIEFVGKDVMYNGKTHSLVLTGTLPEGVTVEYEGNGKSAVGNYTVTAKFLIDGVHDARFDMTADLIIRRATIDASVGTTLIEKIYDGMVVEAPTLIWGEGFNKDDINVTITGAENIKFPGEYVVTYKFAPKTGLETNYNTKEDIVVRVSIAHNSTDITEGLTYELVGGKWVVTGVAGTPASIIIPQSYTNGTTKADVVSVKSSAFAGCTSIEYVYIPSTVTNIGNGAFDGCTNLGCVRYSENLAVIGTYAFRGTALTEVMLPDSLTVIGYGAFAGANSIKVMRVPFIGGSHETSHSFFGYIFGATQYSANDTNVPASLEEVIVSAGAGKIPAFSFYGLSGIKNIIIESGITEIGNNAFAGCTGFDSIYIPASVTKIPASAGYESSPFYQANEDLLIVFEASGAFGKYFAAISAEKSATVAYYKTYEDYLVNKDNYRVLDPTDSKLVGIYIGDEPIPGFDPNVFNYTIERDIAEGYGIISVMKSSKIATVEDFLQASVKNNVVTIKVISSDASTTTTYTITINITGEFNASGEVVVKGGAAGTVVYVVDDGFHPTASWLESRMLRDANLSVSFTVATKNFAEFSTTVGEDGVTRYNLDENGNYIFTQTDGQLIEVDYWRNILRNTMLNGEYRAEVVSHTHTHYPWGVNDEGGMYLYGKDGQIVSKFDAAEGNIRKEIYGSAQIVKDLFGEVGSRGITLVTAGIIQNGSNYTVTSDYSLTLTNRIVHLNEAANVTVSADGTTATLSSDVVIRIPPITVTLPAGTVIKAATSELAKIGAGASGTLPADIAVTVTSAIVTIPANTVITGYNEYYYELHRQAIEDGVLIGSRSTGSSVYTSSSFTDLETRMKLKSMMITTTDNSMTKVNTWKTFINNALSNQGIAVFCIHAIVDDVEEYLARGSAAKDQGGHVISKAQAQALFDYTSDLADEGRVWVAKQTDAMLYYYQWSTSTVTTVYNESNSSINVTLTDKEENNEIYNMELTVKVAVPGTWVGATANGEELTIKTNSDGTKYILVDVAPDSTLTVQGK